MAIYNAEEKAKEIQEKFLKNYDARDQTALLKKGRDIDIFLDVTKMEGLKHVPEDVKRNISNLDETEVYIRDMEYENLIAFDKDGRRIFFENGGPTSGRIPVMQERLLRDAVFTHNHPISVVGDSRKLSSGLSVGDVASMIKLDMKEMRAVSGDYIYSLKKTTDKIFTDDTKRKIAKALGDAQKEFDLWYNNYAENNVGKDANDIAVFRRDNFYKDITQRKNFEIWKKYLEKFDLKYVKEDFIK